MNVKINDRQQNDRRATSDDLRLTKIKSWRTAGRSLLTKFFADENFLLYSITFKKKKKKKKTYEWVSLVLSYSPFNWKELRQAHPSTLHLKWPLEACASNPQPTMSVFPGTQSALLNGQTWFARPGAAGLLFSAYFGQAPFSPKKKIIIITQHAVTGVHNLLCVKAAAVTTL